MLSKAHLPATMQAQQRSAGCGMWHTCLILRSMQMITFWNSSLDHFITIPETSIHGVSGDIDFMSLPYSGTLTWATR